MSGEAWRAWLGRAESNLARARLGRQSEDILYEDICFDAQQSALLSDYAVTTRHPGDWEPVGEDEYRQALAHAEEVWKWAVSVTRYK